jgi:hypothetical protein
MYCIVVFFPAKRKQDAEEQSYFPAAWVQGMHRLMPYQHALKEYHFFFFFSPSWQAKIICAVFIRLRLGRCCFWSVLARRCWSVLVGNPEHPKNIRGTPVATT